MRRLRGLRQEHVQPSGQSDALALQPPSCTEEELHSVLSLACYDWRTNRTVCLCANRCWLSTENNFIWSFIGPACLIILVRLERRPPLTPFQDTRLNFYVCFFCFFFLSVFFASGQPVGFWSDHLQSVPSHRREKAGNQPL